MSSSLKVGSEYSIYTKYSSIVGVKAKVIGIITYDECSKYSYDISVLAINERVISIKDEDLESEIGNDNIYLLRAINTSVDGTYNEYIIWDSIINYDKTIALNEEYKSTLSIKIDNSTEYGISQIIQTIKSAVKSAYGSSVELNISTPETSTSTSTESMTTTLTTSMLNTAESVIDSLNALQNKLIPAAQQIIDSNISRNISSISEDIATIKNEISLVKRGL